MVTIESVTTLVVALTALAAALVPIFVQLRGLRKDLNGTVAALVATTAVAAHKSGELAGRDFVAAVKPSTDIPLTPPAP